MEYKVDAAFRVGKVLPDSFHKSDVKGAIEILAEGKIESGQETRHPAWQTWKNLIDKLIHWKDSYRDDFWEGFKKGKRLPELPTRALLGAVWCLVWSDSDEDGQLFEEIYEDVSEAGLEVLLFNDGHRVYDMYWPTALLIQADKSALTFKDWCGRLERESWCLSGSKFWIYPENADYPMICRDDLKIYSCSEYDKARLERRPKVKGRVTETERLLETDYCCTDLPGFRSPERKRPWEDEGQTSDQESCPRVERVKATRFKANEAASALEDLREKCGHALAKTNDLYQQRQASLQLAESLHAKELELYSWCEKWKKQITQVLHHTDA